MYKEKTLKMELFSEICFFDPRNHDWFHNRNPMSHQPIMPSIYGGQELF